MWDTATHSTRPLGDVDQAHVSDPNSNRVSCVLDQGNSLAVILKPVSGHSVSRRREPRVV